MNENCTQVNQREGDDELSTSPCGALGKSTDHRPESGAEEGRRGGGAFGSHAITAEHTRHLGTMKTMYIGGVKQRQRGKGCTKEEVKMIVQVGRKEGY